MRRFEKLVFALLALIVASCGQIEVVGPSTTSGGGGAGSISGPTCSFISTNLFLWLKADAITGLNDGDSVTTWSDSSGNNRDATQATASRKPTYRTGILNSKPVLRFDGDDYLATASTQLFATTSSGLSVFIVFSTTNNSGQKFLINHGIGGNQNFEIGYDTGNGTGSGNFGIHRGSSNAVIAAANTISNNTYTIMGLIVGTSGSTPTNITIFKNGASQSVSNDVSGWIDAGNYRTDSKTIEIGARNDQGSGTYDSFHTGDIAEIVIYSSNLSSTDRQSVECYLSTKYGISI